MECTHWPDGIPTWLGGSGDEWLHCCVAHDLSDQPMLASDLALFKCVTDAGHWLVAIVMLIGLVTIGVAFRRLWRGQQTRLR